MTPALDQQIDGGSLEWPNGIIMSTSVLDYSPIDGALGDGSWDLSNYQSGSYLLQLRYEIAVPDSYERSFTRASSHCPGSLSSLSGAGDAVTAVDFIGFGDDDSPSIPLYDDIFPGGTKWGVATYVISPEVYGDTLILQSSCGGVEEIIARQSLG